MSHEPAAVFDDHDPSAAPSGSGVSILDSHRALLDIVGAEVVERALAKVPADVATEYRELLAVSWMRVERIETIYRAIAEEAGMPLEQLQVETVRRGVDRTVRGAWKMLLRLTTDEALIKRTPLLYNRAYNVGSLEAIEMVAGHATLKLTGFGTISDFALLGLAAGIEGVLRSAGRKDAAVTFERTPDGARLTARWHRG